MQFVVDPVNEDEFEVTTIKVGHSSGDVQTLDAARLSPEELVEFVRERESGFSEEPHPRWVWADTSITYAFLLSHGVRVERCHDLRKSRAILRGAAWTDSRAFSEAPNMLESNAWNFPPAARSDALFTTKPRAVPELLTELRRQLTVLKTAEPALRGRLNFLLAAESAGTLIAAEMTHAGIPWIREIHDSILAEALGPRPLPGTRPNRLESLAQQIRDLLDAPGLNPDSPRELLKALNQAGFAVKSTNKWEIKNVDHPAVPALLEYKKLSRMMTANGWTWMDEWIKDGRFRPIYVPGGAATGRWGADGGGALQLPHFVRPAVVADEGWSFVIADAAQVEPRILAAMSGDRAMASAGRGLDMYQAIADAGITEDRSHAKYGMLGAMYGGTTGVSAQVLPKFKVAFPRAMGMLERAARAGEQGSVVHTWLGRTSAPGSFDGGVEGEDAASAKDRRARARGYGRFTRNFIVQGSAAEWALCWMASVRQQLWRLSLKESAGADGAAPLVTAGPHLVFFLHDEILVHTPSHLAPAVARIVEDAAREAGRLLFGQTDVEFPITAAVNSTYTDPKS